MHLIDIDLRACTSLHTLDLHNLQRFSHDFSPWVIDTLRNINTTSSHFQQLRLAFPKKPNVGAFDWAGVAATLSALRVIPRIIVCWAGYCKKDLMEENVIRKSLGEFDERGLVEFSC